jgi:hypothetical protein
MYIGHGRTLDLPSVINKMFSLHTICFFRQDDGDAGDDDVSSDDNTDILSSL